jgi:hypothetical protein
VRWQKNIFVASIAKENIFCARAVSSPPVQFVVVWVFYNNFSIAFFAALFAGVPAQVFAS